MKRDFQGVLSYYCMGQGTLNPYKNEMLQMENTPFYFIPNPLVFISRFYFS